MAPPEPEDPFSELAATAAQVAEIFTAYVKAGIPPHHVAVMLGTWMATGAITGQQPDDGG